MNGLLFSEILKFNPYHDRLGRFSTSGAATSFNLWSRRKTGSTPALFNIQGLENDGKDLFQSKQQQAAVARAKDIHSNQLPSAEQEKTLKSIESKTRNLKNEQLRVIDRDGNVILTKKGGNDSVSHSVGEGREYFEGNITIHNHPDGGTFSSADLSQMGYRPTEIRAAAPEGTYILRDIRSGTKYNAGKEKTWYDMKTDLEQAETNFKSYFKMRDEVGTRMKSDPEYTSIENKKQKIFEDWNKARNDGDTEKQSSLAKEFESLNSIQLERVKSETRKAVTDQYHNWYRENAGNYGFEYDFKPTRTRAKKSFYFDFEEGIRVIEKQETIDLDGDMNKDIQELSERIYQEISLQLPIEKSRTFYEILKFNPYHGSDGRFTTAGNATSFNLWSRRNTGSTPAMFNIEGLNNDGKDLFQTKQQQTAVAREKERTASTDKSPEEKRKEAIKSVEDKIRNQSYESAAIIDKDGNQLLFKDGEKSEVSFTPDEAKKCRDATLTHNHPSGSCFSPEDVKMFVVRDLREIRATTASGKTYVLRRKGTIEESDKNFEKEYKFIQNFVKNRNKSVQKSKKELDDTGLLEDLRSGKVSQEEANRRFSKLISEKQSKYLSRYAKNYNFEFLIEEE